MERVEDLPSKEKQFVGGYVAKRRLGHLALYVANSEGTRSSLIETLLTKTLDKAPSVEELCLKLAEKIFDAWKKDTHGGIAVKWETFIRRTTTSLQRKKIPDPYIRNILEKVHRMKSNEK